MSGRSCGVAAPTTGTGPDRQPSAASTTVAASMEVIFTCRPPDGAWDSPESTPHATALPASLLRDAPDNLASLVHEFDRRDSGRRDSQLQPCQSLGVAKDDGRLSLLGLANEQPRVAE